MFRMLMEMVGKQTITIKELKTLVTEEKQKQMKSLSGKSNMRKHELMNYA